MAFNNRHAGGSAGLGFVRKSRFAMDVPGGAPPQPAAPNRYAQQPPANYAQGPRRKRGHKIAAVAVVIVLLVLALGFAFNYSAAQGKGWFGSSAEIYVNINNANTADDITVTITVNDQEVGKKTLSDGNDWTLTFKPFFGDNKTFDIEVDVKGSNALWSNQDPKESVTVEQGQSTNVQFIVW